MPLKRESRRRLLGLVVIVMALASFFVGQYVVGGLGWGADFFANFSGVLLALVAIISLISARFQKDPRRIFFPFYLAAGLIPMVLIAVGGQLGSVELVSVALGLLFISLFFLLRHITIDQTDPVAMTPKILMLAMKGTSPSADEPKRVSLPFKNLSAGELRQFGRHLKRSRIAAYARTRGRRTTIAFGRLDARRFRILYPWALLFGSTKVILEPGRAEVSVDPRTYSFLERPGPYEAYCRELLSLIGEEYDLFKSAGEPAG